MIKSINKKNGNGYLIKKRFYFLGKPIKYGYINPSWHLRLFKAGKGFCEDRNYDQHFVSNGKLKKINGLLLDLQSPSLERWIESHKKWAQAEAKEVLSNFKKTKVLKPNLRGDERERKRWMKQNIYYKFPPFIRSSLFYLYSYFFKLGFLDGFNGAKYHFLHSFWFRWKIDENIIENKSNEKKIL